MRASPRHIHATKCPRTRSRRRFPSHVPGLWFRGRFPEHEWEISFPSCLPRMTRRPSAVRVEEAKLHDRPRETKGLRDPQVESEWRSSACPTRLVGLASGRDVPRVALQGFGPSACAPCLRAGVRVSQASSANLPSEQQASAGPRESPWDRCGPQRVAAASQDVRGVDRASEHQFLA